MLIHTVLEVLSVVLCLAIAKQGLARSNDFCRLAGLVFGVVAYLDTMHLLVALTVPHAVISWVPWSWAAIRITLAIGMLMVTLWVAGLLTRRQQTMTLFAMGAVVLIGLGPWAQEFAWVHLDSWAHRPMDVLAFAVWMMLAGFFWTFWPEGYCKPRHLFAFLFFGIAAHAVMALGSTASLDDAFNVAHGLKVMSYGALAWGVR